MIKNIDSLRVYGRKKGKKKFNKEDLDNIKKFRFDFSKICNEKIIIDVGSGNGENALELSKNIPDYIIIASDVFKDGNFNLSKSIVKNKINNIKIYEKNVIVLFNYFINKKIDQIWILFPDPWPKRKHFKRRLINKNFFKIITKIIKPSSKIYIATDSKNYLINILYDIKLGNLFKWANDIPPKWDYNNLGLVETKYFRKAAKNNRNSFFIELLRI